jgi:hypothetical protein
VHSSGIRALPVFILDFSEHMFFFSVYRGAELEFELTLLLCSLVSQGAGFDTLAY